MKRIITIAVVLALIGLVAFRLINNKEEIDASTKIPENTNVLVAVNTAPAEKRMSSQNLNLVGTVTANQVIDVKSEVQGKITGLYVKLGDYVKKGHVIARIDNKIQELALSNAEQKLADAKQNYERYQNLYKGGAASKSQYDQYKLAYENAQNGLSQAKKEVSNAAIVAPVSGQITEKPVESGAFVNVGNSIATVVDISKLKVELSVAEKDAYALAVGDSVHINTSVYPGITYQGKITFISPRGDDAHNYPVEVALANRNDHPLKAGTYVNVNFHRNNQLASLQIPREALVGSVKNAQVYVVKDSLAHLQDITVGADNGAYLEVLNGLKAGDQVVTTGQINLTDSTQVNVIK